MDISAVAEQVSAEQMQLVYQMRDMSALKGAIEVQAMVQAELTAMIREILPNLAQNIDILV